MATTSLWPHVPLDIFFVVVSEKQLSLADIARMATVCKPWRSILLENDWFGLPINAVIGKTPFPWLMLAESESASSNTSENRRFLNPATGQVSELYLPEAKGRRCAGSGYGWIVTMAEDTEINLLNPLTRKQFKLPSKFIYSDGCVMDLSLWPPPDQCPLNPNCSNWAGAEDEYLNTFYSRKEVVSRFIHRAILTCNPKTSECMVVASIGGTMELQIVFTKLGSSTWTHVPSPPYLGGDIHWGAENLLFYRGKLFALTFEGDLWELDLYGNVNRGWKVISPTINYRNFQLNTFEPGKSENFQYYLAIISNDFIVVMRNREMELSTKTSTTLKIVVFKLLLETEEWCQIDEIGNCCLFLGINETICLFPPPKGFRSNCIYFTDDLCYFPYDYHTPGRDMVVYSMEDDELSPFYGGELLLSEISPSMWVTLNYN